MANSEYLAILKEGTEAWNRWRNEHPEVGTDHYEIDLSGADLRCADLNGANLCTANLSEANLVRADLGHALLYAGANLAGAKLAAANLADANIGGTDLSGADLTGADLSGACLIETDLRDAKLKAADLGAADLSRAQLSGADLTGATIIHTTFGDVDLSEVKGLEDVDHAGPSIVGIDTIYKSKGKIPHVFLRGAGIPENFIKYMASLVGAGIEFYSLFISYSTHDQEFAERLHADLQGKGVRCWFAPHDIQGGKKLHEQIDDAIRVHDKLLLILSPASMASEWVKTEIAKARKREIRENRRVLFPIRLCSFETLRDWECFDADTGKDSAREVREYLIPDFSNWKDHDSYRLDFDRLLRDLQGEPKPFSTPQSLLLDA
jgi:uncharacterized protein YjbI with pentapeptide repeats